MKEILHKLSIFIFFIYMISMYICSFITELNPISQAIFIMLFGITFFYVALKMEIIIPKGIYFHIVFLFLMILSCYWIIKDFTASQRNVTMVLLFFLTIIIVNVVNDEKNLNSALKILFFSGILMCLYSLGYYGYDGTMDALKDDTITRLGGEINEANIFGMICALTASVGLCYAYIENRGIYYILSVIPIVYCITSGSRMAILILLVSIIILLLSKRGKNKLTTFFIWFFSILTLIIIINYISSQDFFVFKRFEKTFNIFKSDYLHTVDNSSDTRLRMMIDGFKWFLDKPLFGYGTDQYGILYAEHYGMYRYSHSNFIEVLVNHGIVGFTVYYSLYVYIAYYIFKAVKMKLNYSVMMLIILGFFAVTNVFFVMLYLKITYVLIGILLAYITINKPKLLNRM